MYQSPSLMKIIGIIAGSLIYIFLRAISPLVLIRFVSIRGDRIGHLTSELDAYLSNNRKLANDVRPVNIFFFASPPCNDQLEKMVKRRLFVGNGAIRLVHRLVALVDINSLHTSSGVIGVSALDAISGTPLNLWLNSSEISKGETELFNTFGVRDQPIALIYSRDRAYLDLIEPQPKFSSLHRIHDFRDSDVSDLVPAAEFLMNKGYSVIRVGSKVKSPYPICDGVIDYPYSILQSDFFDVYLFQAAQVFLGGNSGIAHLMRMFRKPCITFNVAPMFTYEGVSLPNEILIPKLYADLNSGRILSCTEIKDRNLGRIHHSKQFQKENVRLVDNSPEDILNLVKEYLEDSGEHCVCRDNGSDILDKFYHKCGLEHSLFPRVGRRFLKTYAKELFAI